MALKLKKPKEVKEVVNERKPHKCNFCDRSFYSERSLLIHVCDQKSRFLARDNKHVRMGFKAYQKVMTFLRMSSKGNFDDFDNSKFYTAFVKFGKFIIDLNAIQPMGFVDFLIRIEIPIDKWCSMSLYETYIREMTKVETPSDAIERNILLMQQWADDTGEHWSDFFRKVSPVQATMWIMSGRVSPWVLYTAPSAAILFDKFTDEQLSFIQNTIDPDFWQRKIEQNKKEVDNIKKMLEEAGL